MRTKFAAILLAAVVGNLVLELRAIRHDLTEMKTMYEGFLKRKIGGKTIEESIRPGSMAVFKAKSHTVGCAILK